MRNIASLLFGNDAGELLDLISGEGGITGEGDREAADRGPSWPRGIVIRNGRI
jgi:hypothetical protein